MTTASMQKPIAISHETSERPQDEPRIPPAARLAIQRMISNMYSLWCLCEKRACWRAHRCKGNPDECLETLTPLLASEVIDGGLCMLKGKAEDLSFDELYARHPDAIAAIAHWTSCINRRSVPRSTSSCAKKAANWPRQAARARNSPER